MLIIKGNAIVKGISDMNRDILVITHSLSYEKKLAYNANFFPLMYTNLIHRKLFVLKLLHLHQLSQDMLYVKLVLTCFENFDFLVYHIKYVHSPEVV